MKKFAVGLVVVALVIVSVPSSAQTQNEQTNTSRAAVKYSEARGRLLKDKCDILAQRVKKVQTSADDKHIKSKNISASLQQKLSQFVERAENANLDVNTLKSDLEELDTKLAGLNIAWEKFHSSLDGINNVAVCSGAENLDVQKLHEAIESSKVSHSELKQSLTLVIEFVKTTIKSDLLDLRQQLRTN